MNVKQYLSKIGRKGGLKRAQHPRKRELAIHAANARWSNAKRLSKQNECQSCQTAENKL